MKTTKLLLILILLFLGKISFSQSLGGQNPSWMIKYHNLGSIAYTVVSGWNRTYSGSKMYYEISSKQSRMSDYTTGYNKTKEIPPYIKGDFKFMEDTLQKGIVYRMVDDTARLLYNFNLKIGDTSKIYSELYPYHLASPYLDYRVKDVRDTTLNSKKLKMWKLEIIDTQYVNKFNRYFKGEPIPQYLILTLIEKIGIIKKYENGPFPVFVNELPFIGCAEEVSTLYFCDGNNIKYPENFPDYQCGNFKVGIENQSPDNQIAVYFDPLNKNLQLNNIIDFNQQYLISDIQGRIIKSGIINSSKIDLSPDYLNGIYLLKIISNKGSIQTLKFLVD